MVKKINLGVIHVLYQVNNVRISKYCMCIKRKLSVHGNLGMYREQGLYRVLKSLKSL